MFIRTLSEVSFSKVLSASYVLENQTTGVKGKEEKGSQQKSKGENKAEIPEEMEKKIKSMTQLSLWALGGTATTCQLEYDDIGSVRVQLKSERRVVFIHLGALHQFLIEKKHPRGPGDKDLKLGDALKYTLQEISTALKSFKVEDLTTLAKKHSGSVLCHKSVPGELLYTPAGWLVAESIADQKALASGFRIAALSRSSIPAIDNIALILI